MNEPYSSTFPSRAPVPMPPAATHGNGAHPSAPAQPSIELGRIADWLQRALGERYQAPPDDPIHANVEIVRGMEMIAIHLLNGLQIRSQREAEVLQSLSTAHRELGDLAKGERNALSEDINNARKEVGVLTESVKNAKGAYEDAKPLIEGLPALQAVIKEDVDARARERWGQGVVLLLTALVFLVFGIGITAYFFNRFLSHAVPTP